jgi:PKD repeat protein
LNKDIIQMKKLSYNIDIRRGTFAGHVVAAISCFAIWFGALASCPAQEKRQLSPDELQSELLKLTGGARVKLVWQQDENAIVAFDTEGANKRTLYSGAVGERCWPIITPDGSKVLFAITDSKDTPGPGSGKLYAIDWNAPEGTAPVELGSGMGVLALWRDPAGETWVYIATRRGSDRRLSGLERFPLSDPSKRSLVWDKTDTDAPLSLSADGRFVATQIQWPNTGIFTYPNGSAFIGEMGGCNSNILPDNSYRMFHVNFDHKGLYVYDRLYRDDRKSSRLLPLLVDGDKVDRARISNRPEFFTFFGPMGNKEYEDSFFAKFDKNYEKIEGQVRLTANGKGHSTLPYAWVDPGDYSSFAYLAGRFLGKAPLKVDFQYPFPAGNVSWDFGDGQTGTGAAPSHTYDKPGEYKVLAKASDGKTFDGLVTVVERTPPMVESVDVKGANRLHLVFNEKIRLKDASIRLASGDPVSSFALDLSERRLIVDLAGPLREQDKLVMVGIFDLEPDPTALVNNQVEVKRPFWPANPDGIIALWSPKNNYLKSEKGEFEPMPYRDADLVSPRSGESIFDGWGRARVHTSPPSSNDALFNTKVEASSTGLFIAKSGEFTIELGFSPRELEQEDPDSRFRDPDGAVVLVSQANSFQKYNFIIGQKGRDLLMKLNTSGKEGGGWVKIATLESPGQQHLIAAFKDGDLRVWLNGQKQPVINDFSGSLDKWAKLGGKSSLNFLRLAGNSSIGWRGWIDSFILHNAALTDQQAESAHAAHQRWISEVMKFPSDYLLRVNLKEKSKVPSPESIAPYSQALVVNEYEVVETLQSPNGAKPLPAGSVIRLQEWGVRNGKAFNMPRDVKFEPGQYTNRVVRVQRVEDNPQLATELVFDTLPENFDAEVFLHPEPWIIERQN